MKELHVIFNSNSLLSSRDIITIILASHISNIQMAKLRIIWKKSVNVKNAFIFHMVRPVINLPQ